LIFPHLPPEQDVKLAVSAGVTDVTGWPELQDIGLAANSQRVSDRLYNLLAAGEGGRCPNRGQTRSFGDGGSMSGLPES